jgi:ParB family chromosome partitioning protein
LGPGRSADDPVSKASQLREIAVDLIQRGRYQPRTNFDQGALEELAESIRAQGVVQPVVVRPVRGGKFELVAGERRWRAVQLAGLSTLPAVVRDVDDESALALALIENIQRENLGPLEEALALSRLIEEFDLTHEAAAQAVGRSRAAVSNLLRLLELGTETRELLESGQLEMGHARALLGLRGGNQAAVAREVVARGLSVRETEALVRKHDSSPGKPRQATQKPVDPDLRRLQQSLSEQLGAAVKIEHKASGGGRLLVEYTSLEQLDGVLERIRGASNED